MGEDVPPREDVVLQEGAGGGEDGKGNAGVAEGHCASTR